MRLFVMIPAHNEEQTIAQVIRTIPRSIPGIESITAVVINDGSTDKTAQRAKESGAYVLSHPTRQGLAQTFQHGLNFCLKHGADIVVNIDGDGQYDSAEIPKVIKPIAEKWADIVLTNRNVLSLKHMPFGKKYGNIIATFVTRLVSGFPVKDAQSGFRAFSREAALRITVRGSYTYVQETIIQAVDKRLRIVQTNCTFRKRTGGSSRLISNIWSYAKRAGSMLLRSYVRYKPLKVFLIAGILVSLPGFFFSLRYLAFWLNGEQGAHIQSLIAAAVFLIVGFQLIMLALLADTIDANRTVSEEALYRIKKMEYR
ncbi:MAG: glycosyltransferase family 2 protein [Candidatus Woesearchaeota archaeon]